jgi:ribosome maturation factor RimP
MSRENQIETVEKLLQPLLTDDIFLVDIRIKPINNIKIFLDADSGLGIEKCIKINRALYKIMEEIAIIPTLIFPGVSVRVWRTVKNAPPVC